MLRLIAEVFIVLIFSLNISSAQSIDITPNADRYIKTSVLNPRESQISSLKDTNLKSNLGIINRLSDVSTNADGSIFCTNNAIYGLINGVFQQVDLPIPDTSAQFRGWFPQPRITMDEKTILYYTYKKISGTDTNYELQNTLHFMNLESRNTEADYTFEGYYTGFRYNADATVFTYYTSYDQHRYVYIVKRNNDAFNTHIIEFSFTNNGQILISSSGDRVFYAGRSLITEEHDLMKHYQVEKNDNGWSEPTYFELLDSDGQPLEFEIRGIANNGRTLFIRILYSAEIGSHDETKLAVVYEENGKWGNPHFIDYTPQHEKSIYFDRYDISETGEVIAVQSLKNDANDPLFLYDIFLYFHTPAGQWIKQQVNPPNVDAVSSFHLTQDGTKLFWLPYESMAMPGTAKMK